jgi:hypothetical protein
MALICYSENKKMYQNLKSKQTGGDVSDPDEENRHIRYLGYLHSLIKESIYDSMHPYRDMRSIPTNIKYDERDISKKKINSNCHLGQRKLLLTEIEFYTECINHSQKNNIVIYAGSATCEHISVIMELFPGLKFILIDPNFHSISGEHPYSYLYQNVDVISGKNLKLFREQLRYKHKEKKNNYSDRAQHLKNNNYSDRAQHLKNNALLLENVKFVNDQTHNVLNIKDMDHIKKMGEIKDGFYQEKYANPINSLIESEHRIFIIQDYMTLTLSRKIKEYLDKSKYHKNMYFLTDIRTQIISGGPTDIDILWNSALQMMFLKELRPIFSMLKFRPPYFSNIDETKTIYENMKSDPQYKYIMDDLNYVKDNYNLDLMGNYFNDKFNYFDNSFIYTQAWGPGHTSECRLFLSDEKIDNPYILYDHVIHDNQFYFIRIIRNFKYYPIFYEKLKQYDKNEYDGCYDCMREIQILGNYLINDRKQKHDINTSSDIDHSSLSDSLSDSVSDPYPLSDNLSDPYLLSDNLSESEQKNIQAIEKNLHNPEFVNQILKIYKLINKYTFFDLSRGNFKCPQHGGMIRQSKYMDFYANDGDNVIMYRIDTDSNVTPIIVLENILHDDIKKSVARIIQNNKRHGP